MSHGRDIVGRAWLEIISDVSIHLVEHMLLPNQPVCRPDAFGYARYQSVGGLRPAHERERIDEATLMLVPFSSQLHSPRRKATADLFMVCRWGRGWLSRHLGPAECMIEYRLDMLVLTGKCIGRTRIALLPQIAMCPLLFDDLAEIASTWPPL